MDELSFHIDRLKFPDFSTRRQSAEMLGEFGDARAVKPLLQLLGDDYWQVRNTVVEALLKIRDRSSITPLLECLRDEDPGVRNTAMSVLNEMGEDVAAPLTRLLIKDPQEDVRIFAANTLGRLHTPEAVPGLIEGLKDADENVRYACAEGLGRLAFHAATEPLLAAMEREETWARFPYIAALGIIGDERACASLAAALDDEVLSFPAVIALGQIADAGALPSLAALLQKTEDPSMIRACIVALSNIERRAGYFSKVERQAFFHARVLETLKGIGSARIIRILIEMVLAGDEGEKAAAASVLRFVKGNIPVERLFPLLSDEEKEEDIRDIVVRQGAAVLPQVVAALRAGGEVNVNQLLRVLGILGDESAAEVAAPFLDSPDIEVVCDALKCLGMLNSTSHFDRMAQALSSPEEHIRNAAVGGISLVRKSPEMVKRVLELLSSNDELARRGGYRILGFLSSLQTSEYFLTGLADPVPTVRAAAAQSLGYVAVIHHALAGQREYQEAFGRLRMDESAEVRIEGLLAFARINHPCTRSLLLDALRDDDAEVRSYAIRAVGRCRLREAEPLLLQQLAAEENPEFRIFLCHALSGCGGAGALEVLWRQADDPVPEVVAEALRAIGTVAGASSVDRLIPFLEHGNWIVQDAVVAALAEVGTSRGAAAVARFIGRLREGHGRPLLLRAAMRTLGKIGGPGEIDLVLSFLGEEACQYEAIEAAGLIAGRTGLEVRPGVLETPVARRLACTIAAAAPSHGTAEALGKLLADPYPSVRRAAALALMNTGAGALARARCADDTDNWVREIINVH